MVRYSARECCRRTVERSTKSCRINVEMNQMQSYMLKFIPPTNNSHGTFQEQANSWGVIFTRIKEKKMERR